MKSDLSRLIQLHQQQAHQQALNFAQQLIGRYPEQPLPHNITGVIHMGRGEYQAAAESFRRALEIAPDYLDASSNLGAASTALKNHELAIQCFGKVVAARPKDAQAQANLGHAYRNKGQLDAAARCYQNSLDIRPENPHVCLNLGLTLMDMRMALAKSDSAIVRAPEHAATMKMVANAYRELGQLKEAIEWCQRAIEAGANDAETLCNLGKMQLKTGDKEAAKQQLRRALELQPDSAEAKHFLAAAEGDTASAAPATYITSMFDQNAEQFDAELVEALGYDAPKALRELAEQAGALTGTLEQAVDLGCGTGLSGAAFRDCCQHLVGIDLSGEMLAQAERKGLYDQLIKDDVIDGLALLQQSFDLILCADTVIYMGRLDNLFQAVAERANPGALFILSTESSSDQDLVLRDTGRYAHSDAYIQGLAREHGFDTVAYQQQNLRTELRQWLQGGFYVLRRR